VAVIISEQQMNASILIALMVLGMSMHHSDEQYVNASPPISSNPFPRVTAGISEQ
jgi:hypothetical protein